VTISPVLSTRKTFAALSSWRMAPRNLDDDDDDDPSVARRGGGL
jgi:hypothetical protein